MVTSLVSYNEPSSLEKPWPSISGKHQETVEKSVSRSKLRGLVELPSMSQERDKDESLLWDSLPE